MSGIVLVVVMALLAKDESQPGTDCANVISEAALYRELAKDPHFLNGVPPQARQCALKGKLRLQGLHRRGIARFVRRRHLCDRRIWKGRGHRSQLLNASAAAAQAYQVLTPG